MMSYLIFFFLSIHSEIGHGGRTRMDSELKSKHCNKTNETIMAYLSFCV